MKDHLLIDLNSEARTDIANYLVKNYLPYVEDFVEKEKITLKTFISELKNQKMELK